MSVGGRKGLLEMFMGQAGNGSGVDDFVQDWNNTGALAGAAAMAFADGDDNILVGAATYAADAWAMSNVLGGEQTFASQLWMSFRTASVASHQMSQLDPEAGFIKKAFTFAGAGVAAWAAIDQWENHWDGVTPAESSFNVPFVPGI